MDRRHKRTMALPGGVNWADIEFEWELPQPARPKKKPAAVKQVAKPAKKTVEPAKVVPVSPEKKALRERKSRNRHRKIQRFKAARRKRQEKKFARHLKEIARIVAFDLLEIRAESFEENERKWREQQQREAKAYAEKFSAAFREAVQKEAAEKTAA